MNRFRKAIAAGMSAALLASLFTVIAASTALAATTVAGVTVPRGGTSATSATFTFTENSAACFPTTGANPALVFTIETAGVTFTGTPAISRPDSLGATITSTSTSFSIRTLGSDTANVESMVVTGLKLKASTSAPLGAVSATLTGDAAWLACVLGTATATGTLGTNVDPGGTASVIINVSSACPFANTALPTPSNVTFATGGPDGRTLSSVTALSGGIQTATFSATTAVPPGPIHSITQTVSQTVAACASFLSPGTVVDSVVQDIDAESPYGGVPTNVAPGEQNQSATPTSIRELTAGYIPVGTLTYTLSAAGVQFSTSPTVTFNSTFTVVPPTGLTATASITGGTLAAGTYCYGVTTKTALGETPDGSIVCATVASGTTGSVALSWTAAYGATGYNIDGRPATAGGTFGLIGSTTTATTFTDINAGAPGLAPPTVSSAGTTPTLFAAGGVCNVSFDRMSCSVAVTHVSVAPVTVWLSGGLNPLTPPPVYLPLKLDVASTVAAGTAVNVVVTSSPAINVAVTNNNIANVARVIVGTAAQPVIYINYNDQATGMITLTEQGAGYFQSGTGNNNRLTICITTGESFTRAPWAVVTAGTGLQFLSGLVGATSVIGTLSTTLVGHVGQSCAYWTVFSASTAAATIEIRGSDSAGVVLPSGALNGPRLSVPAGLKPGTTQMALYSGDGGTVLATLGLVSNATRAFKSGVVVAAVSQPTIPAGTTDSLGGNLTLTETLNGQFKPGQFICVTILPRTLNGTRTQDTFIKMATTNDLPVIVTNSASGLLASTVAVPGCPAQFFIHQDGYTGFTGPFLPNPGASFSFLVNQQSFGGTLGVITISNIHLITTADAANGPVLVDVLGDGGTLLAPAVQFETVVSNARIGSAQVDAWIAAGNNTRAASAFGLNTVIAKQGSRVTFRFRAASATPGTLVQIWVKTKTTAWKLETNRRITSDGYAYYSPRVLNHGYRYYRVAIFGNVSNTVRAFGK